MAVCMLKFTRLQDNVALVSYTCQSGIVLKSTRHKVLLIGIIPEKEYEHLLKKITPTRILMLSEYKGEFQHVSSQTVIDISSSNLPPRKI